MLPMLSNVVEVSGAVPLAQLDLKDLLAEIQVQLVLPE
jgi:hypothetical protein